jgi:hypothetical protein
MTKTQAQLRDRYFTLHTTTPTADEARAFRAEVDEVDAEPEATVDGLPVSAFPTRRHKALRFFEASRVAEPLRADFARPLPRLPHLAAGFVDPSEFSFRTFENIVSLDGFFDGLPLDEVKLEQRTRFGDKQVYAFALGASDAVKARLSQLDALGLCVPPLNARSRGGERFIFHSTQLAEALGRAVKEGLGASLLGGFSHVNPVFRFNRFEPGDRKFQRHLDTPYFDEARKHVSKYTLLIYLTGGEASPTLDVEGAPVLTRVAPFTCVVMDQRLEHEGHPYTAGRKVFLRTELVFEEPNLAHDPAIGAAFASAVYLTGESVFAAELEAHAEAAYNLAANAHWKGLAKTASAPLVHKNFQGLQFVTNGHDFYVPKASATLEEAAALALLDFFNADLGSSAERQAFRKACKSKVLKPGVSAAEALTGCERPAAPAIGVLAKDALMPAPEVVDESACCPFHSMGFVASRCGEIVDLYESATAFVKRRLTPAPVMVMGEQVSIDPSRFVVEGDKVHVLSRSRLAPVNFASCWNFGGSPENYVGVEATVRALQPLVPPILFGSEGALWHLRFDFFRNSWLVKVDENELAIPVIRGLDPGAVEEGEVEDMEDGEAEHWTEAAKGAADEPTSALPKSTLWWGEDSPLLRELNSYRAQKAPR